MSPRKPCTIEDCSKPRHSQGLCNMHRMRFKRTGRLDKATTHRCGFCTTPGHKQPTCPELEGLRVEELLGADAGTEVVL